MVGIVAALPFFARLTLGLPAIAVAEPPGVLGRAWHRGWRNGWRLIWGPFLCSLPLSIVSGIFSAGQRLMEYVAGFGDAWRVIGVASMIVLYVLASITHFLAVATDTFVAVPRQPRRRDATPSCARSWIRSPARNLVKMRRMPPCIP